MLTNIKAHTYVRLNMGVNRAVRRPRFLINSNGGGYNHGKKGELCARIETRVLNVLFRAQNDLDSALYKIYYCW